MWNDTDSDDTFDSYSDSSQSTYYKDVSNKSSNLHKNSTYDHEDVWSPSTNTSLVPILVTHTSVPYELRDVVFALESPRTTLSPHGYSMKSWLHNIKRAIVAENVTHTLKCLTSYFTWFQCVEKMGDNGVRRVLPMREGTVKQSLDEVCCSGGIFNNRWSAFLHQQLHLYLLDIFFEVVGIACPTAIQCVESLWCEYEHSLFSIPVRSLSKLLTIGKILLDAPKSGCIYFTLYCFSDSALLRRRREQVLNNPNVVQYGLKQELAEKVLDVLGKFKPVYFKQRHRKNLYRDWYISQEFDLFLELGNIVHLIQAQPVSDKKASKIITSVLEHVTARKCDSPNYVDTLQYLTTVYRQLTRAPNLLVCKKTKGTVAAYILIMVHLLSVLVTTSTADPWKIQTGCQSDMNHHFCKELLELVQSSSIYMTYGVTTEKSSVSQRRSDVSSVRRSKKRKISPSEQEIIRVNCGPLPVAISHQQIFAGARCSDGFFHASEFLENSKFTNGLLPELEALYYLIMNWQSVVRQYKREQAQLPIDDQPVTDNVILNLRTIEEYGYDTELLVASFTYQRYHSVHHVVQDTSRMYKMWSGSEENSNIVFEQLCSMHDESDFASQRPRLCLVGPLKSEVATEVIHVFNCNRKLRELLGFYVGKNTSRHLTIQDIPLKPQATDIIVGKPYFFCIEDLPEKLRIHEKNGVRFSTTTKPLQKTVSELKQTGLLWRNIFFNPIIRCCFLLGMYFEVFSSENEWKWVEIHQSFLLRSSTCGTSREVWSSRFELVVRPTPHRYINTEQNIHCYDYVLDLLGGDEDKFNNTYRVLVPEFMKAVIQVYPTLENPIYNLLNKIVW